MDISGPVANLIIGLAALKLISTLKQHRLFLFQLAAYNLFWFAGTIINSAFSKMGDWTFALEKLHAGAFNFPLLMIAGVFSYVLIMRLLNNAGKRVTVTKQEIYCAFLFATISACIAGFLFKENRNGSAFEALLEMLASLPLLFLRFGNSPQTVLDKKKNPLLYSIFTLAFYFVFCLTLGRGITW